MEEQDNIGQGRLTTCKICKHKFRIKKEDKEKWREKKFNCPNCGEIYCILPKTERKLRILQDKFFESGRKESYMTEIYKVLLPYTKSLLLKSFPSAVQSNEHADYITSQAVSYLIEEFYAKENYKIEISFGAMVLYKLKQALYGKMEKQEEAISLNYEFQDGNLVEYEDKKNKIYENIENEHDKYLICEYISELLFSISHFCDSAYEAYTMETALYLFFMKGERKVDNFFQKFSREGKYLYLYALEILKKELEKLCKTRVESQPIY